MIELIVRKYYSSVDAQDLETLLALFASDAWYERPGYARMTGTADLRKFYSDQRMIDEGRHTIDRLVKTDDQVIVQGEFAGHLKDGRRVSLRFADFFEMEAALIAGRRTYFFTALV